MKLFQLSKYSFRHLILGISAATVVVLTLLVALVSSQVAFNEMSNTLYQQSVQLTQNMCEDSIAPLLYDSAAGADNMINTLVDMQQITEASIFHASNKPLVLRQSDGHIRHTYPNTSKDEPFKVIETSDGWYFSALVTSQQGGDDLPGTLLVTESDADAITLGYINLSVSKASIYESRRNIFLRNFIVAAMAGLSILIVMYLVLLNLTRPLEKLSALMEQGRQGNYPEQTDIHGTKEITDMSHTFNEMIAAIKDREQNLALTLNSIGDAVIATDANGDITRMNPVAEKLTGWSLEEASGKAVKDVFHIIDATTQKPISSPVGKVLNQGETIHLSNHTTLVAKDKTEYQISDSAAPIRDEDGNILGMVLAFNDITEQYKLRQDAAKSKRDLQAIMDNSPAVIYIKNSEGRFTFINRQFEKLFHIKQEDITDKTLYDVFPEDLANNMWANDKSVLDTGHALESEEIAPHDDGPHSYLSIKFPLFDDDDNIYAVCGISTDITERRKQDEQLRRTQKMDALGKLTGGVAHDYNNMLGVVMGYSELLKKSLSDQPKLAKYANAIHHAGERGAKLTQKLLAFSRKKESEEDKLDINALLLNEQHMLEKTLTVRIKLVFDLQEDLWPVWLDDGDLEDAILNMCINAMHAIESNGQLTMQTSNQHLSRDDAQALDLTPGDYVLLIITDTGHGMDEVTKENIFEPFYSTKGVKGTGLGLSQVYGFVHHNGGAIQVNSEPDHGSEFMIYIPRYFDVNVNQVTETSEDVTDLSGKESILVVEDEEALRELTSELLNEQGYKVFCAENGIEALQCLEDQQIDLILSDIIMPEMDGNQLASIVLDKYPSIKIQLVSGYTDDRQINTVDANLHQNIINKPYNLQELLKSIRHLLDS